MSSLLSDQAVDMLWMLSTGQLSDAAAEKYPGAAHMLKPGAAGIGISRGDGSYEGDEATIGPPEIQRGLTASIGEPEIIQRGNEPQTFSDMPDDNGGQPPAEEMHGSGDAIEPSDIQPTDFIADALAGVLTGGRAAARAAYDAATTRAAARANGKLPWHELTAGTARTGENSTAVRAVRGAQEEVAAGRPLVKPKNELGPPVHPKKFGVDAKRIMQEQEREVGPLVQTKKLKSE